MRTNILILLFASVLTMVGLASTTNAELVVAHPDGNVTPPGVIATASAVSAATSTQSVTLATAQAALVAGNAVLAQIADMHTNTIVEIGGYVQSANSASAVSDTNVVLQLSTILVTNGVGYLKAHSTKALSVKPDLRFSASMAPKDTFTNLVNGVTCSWPDTVDNDPPYTNGVSYAYSFATTTPNGFYYIFADPMIIPPSGDALLVSGTINVEGWIGRGRSTEPVIRYDLNTNQMTYVGGVLVEDAPVPISTLMAFVGRSRQAVRFALIPVQQKGGRYVPQI